MKCYRLPRKTTDASLSWIRNMTENRPVYQHMRVLASGNASVDVFRPDDRTLVLSPGNGFLTGMLDSLFRASSEPMSQGEAIEIAGVNIEITSVTEDGRPLEARFTFPVPLEDSSLHWLQFTEDGFQPFVPPSVGEKTSTQPVPRLL